ncbi:MAG: hypothetical protein AAB898_01590, partial [Patescibacteria group bacterium]
WITLVAMIQEKTVNGVIVGAVMGATVVVFLALIKGTPGWTKLDMVCLAGAVAGVALWQIYDNAMFGLLVSQAGIFTGSFPTFVSASKNPEQEDRFAWTLCWVGAFLGAISIPVWTLASAAQPVTFLAVETVMMYLLYRSRPATQTS